MINDHWDDYLINGTDVLKNKLNIINKEELMAVEKNITRKTLARAYLKPTCKFFNAQELKSLHKDIFGSIYPFAGEFRLCPLGKNKDNFSPPEQIEESLNKVLAELNNIPEIGYIEQLAFYIAPFYHDLIMIHPFREGNGRTIRVFIREFILERSKKMKCGPLDLDYTKMDSNNLLLETIERYVYPSMLEMEFMKAIAPLERQKNHQV